MNWKSSLSFKITEKDLIPKQKILANFEKINKTKLTFGVHEEDNDKHEARDSLIDKKLHSAYYKDMSPIGNAELLMKNTKGFTTEVFRGGERLHIDVPARPILEPMFSHLLEFDVIDDYVGSGLAKQLSFSNTRGLETSLNSLASKYLNPQQVKLFVESRGGSYWDSVAKHNSPYTAAIKALEMLGQEGLGNVYNRRTGTINKMQEWANGNFWKYGDRPLIDTGDMLNSIKAKVSKE